MLVFGGTHQLHCIVGLATLHCSEIKSFAVYNMLYTDNINCISVADAQI